MKKVKIGGKYKLVPRKVYMYNSLVDSQERLVSKPGFLDQCDLWRKYSNEASHEWLTDVYDGKLWKDCLKKNGRLFLEPPGHLLLMINIDCSSLLNTFHIALE